MQKIKNIIFDLGGVFIEVDYFKTQDAFINLGVTHFNQLYTQQHSSPLFALLETGKVTPGEFYNRFREVSGINLTNEQIRTAWCAMLGNFYTDALDWLTQVGQRYNIFLFSNTNKIHEDAFNITLQHQTGLNSIDGYFKKAYYSHTLGLRKPDVASYQAILDEQNLVAGETMFIDDSIKNVEGALQAGLQGLFLELPRKVQSVEL